MQEELRENPNAYFMTLTIDDKSYKELKKKSDDKTDNGIATKAMRLMLERIRKKTGIRRRYKSRNCIPRSDKQFSNRR